MSLDLRKARAAIARRWKYRFRPTRYRVFLALCEGREPRGEGFFPQQRAIVEEALRLRRSFAGIGSGVPVGSISVVIPHYNQPDFLGEAIRSALAQTFPAKEIIVVDDVSEDVARVRSIEREFAGDPRVRFIFSKEKLYAGGARHRGAALAAGDAVSFVDADDLMHPKRLELSKAVLDARPDRAFVMTSALPFSDKPPEPVPFNKSEALSHVVDDRRLNHLLARRFAVMRLSWIDPATGKVPWYAWGGYGFSEEYQAHSGALTVRKEYAALMKWPTPKDYVFTPYEDYEYCLLLHAATGGGCHIDLPLLFYRKGSTTNDPAGFA